MESRFSQFLSQMERKVVLPDDAENIKRQKLFLYFMLVNGLATSAMVIPFSILEKHYGVHGNVFSSAWLAATIFMFVYCLAVLLLLRKRKSILWPRRCVLSLTMCLLPISLYCRGGVEHCTFATVIIALHLLSCVILYDDFRTPAKWMSAVIVILLAFESYEIAFNPFATYPYVRVVRVAEQGLISIFFAHSSCFMLGAYSITYTWRLSSGRRQISRRMSTLKLRHSFWHEYPTKFAHQYVS